MLFVVLALAGACRSRKKKKKLAGQKYEHSAGVKTTGQGGSVQKEKRYLTSSETRQVIAEARKYMGTPYRYGGASRAGMDCSGLLMASFAGIGKALPRPSKDQATCGTDVTKKDARPADFVVFQDPPGTISHIGMVTEILPDGTIKFIHSSTSLGVIEAKLTDKYWAPRFLKIHRPQVLEGN